MTTTKHTSSLNLAAINIDCADATQIATFWSNALGRPVDDGATTDSASISGGEGWPTFSFVAVPEGKAAKNRLHLDLESTEPGTAVTRLVELGATIVSTYDEGGFRWTTLTDPGGNEFCIM